MFGYAAYEVYKENVRRWFKSPDLAPSDFHLFEPLKKHLAGRHFRTDAEVQETVVEWLRDLDPDFFYAGFDRSVYRWHKCFNDYGDYVEK
ncbi:hypothetical protein AVEN_203230-1 [Araneus ventricosus]|uniref:Histone-lysine N-methyltransferase SETMAR n=1 Tax=Araneus ventricosus TaxID=182803 RepID=A0A4Y2F2S5_ARAVE|nr:hypothetical protein AVEN_203230-1 [Araneus ventricosus]